MVSTMCRPGRCPRQGSRGPLACYGWCRAHSEGWGGGKATTKGLTGHWANREVGRLGRCFSRHVSVVGCGCGRKRHLGRGVACGSGRRFKWCVHRARAGFSGGCLSGTTMNWRGRTVEYSGDPAKRPLVEVSCADFGRSPETAARFVAGCGLGAGKVLFRSTAWGWPQTTPTSESLPDRPSAQRADPCGQGSGSGTFRRPAQSFT